MAVDEATSVYVGGLPYEANEDMLRDAFEYYGTIVAVKVCRPLLPSFCSSPVLSRSFGDGHGFDTVRNVFFFSKKRMKKI
jgi:RNA recognition motif-containing protein